MFFVSTIADCWEVVAVSLDFVLRCSFSSFHAFSATVLFLFSQFRLKRVLFVNGLFISCDLQRGSNGGGYGAYGGYSSGRTDSPM